MIITSTVHNPVPGYVVSPKPLAQIAVCLGTLQNLDSGLWTGLWTGLVTSITNYIRVKGGCRSSLLDGDRAGLITRQWYVLQYNWWLFQEVCKLLHTATHVETELDIV